nr:telomere-associated protein RIF1 isoform X3 [Pogona vitticeps]
MSGADSTTGPCAGSSFLPLLETLEDPVAAPEVLTDALLTLTNRLTGEEGKEFAAEVGKYFPQLCKIFKTHIPTENTELCSAALQALGFCVFNSKIASLLCETEIQGLLSIVNSVAIKSVDKNTLTRALWVISKQSFPPEVVGKLVPSIISVLETVLNKGDLHSMVVEYEALNVIIRLIEQAPSAMEEQAVKWARLIIPLVVHPAHKVQLRGATALEMGVPLLLQKQQEVAAVTEELMTAKIIPELQKLFSSKNETYVLKLWPLFVKLLGKALHRSGSFINSLLQLEELGFRSGSPVVKKIAFIAWKSLIDNFALNPDILCSAKRLKLLMQPLSSIHVRTEALALTKIEVWWYLLMRLGPQLPAHFEQVCIPLIQSTLSLDASLPQGNSSRLSINQSLPGSAQKSGSFISGASASPRMKLNSSIGGMVVIPSIQLLGIEMLLHFFVGPEVLNFAKENSVVLSLEPLQYSVISSPSFFCKHASTFINAVQDGFIAVGKEASDTILSAIWKEMIGFVRSAIESGSKRERQNSEVLTMLLKALKNIVMSKELPVLKSLSLMEITIKELPPKVLGSPAYQVADMDLLNGTPALFLIQLSFYEDLLKCGVQDERFFLNYESLVEFVLSGPTSPLAFSESVISIVNQSAQYLEDKEQLWRIWSILVSPLTEWINQTNEVNQGDALEHNFSAIYSALLLPINHIFPSSEFLQPIMKTLLRSWSDLYRAFARCALLVATAEDNLCCEELCAKVISGLEDETCINQPMLDGLTYITSVMVNCINFAPYGTKYQPANKSPQISTDWSKKKKDPLGKLSSLIKLLVILINSLQMLASKDSGLEKLAPIGASVIGVLQNIIGHISLPSVLRSLFGAVLNPLAAFYEKTKSTVSKVANGLNSKLEKLLMESISCLQSHYTGPFDSELLQELSPLLAITLLNKNKQIRSQAAQFWNATFGKAVTLTYPEGLKSVLCQAKQKTLLLLPGFESIEIVKEFDETFSDSTESSQWSSKISGIEVKPTGKRDSLLSQASELKENNVNSHVTPTKKLELPLLKSKRKNTVLEEENTVDFVFIPPETKERVLTEHQKEVLRTKRVDIPTMYNTLDASQDTTLFSQYTQSQEDSLGKDALVDVKREYGEEENKTIFKDGKVTGDVPENPPENRKPDVLQNKMDSSTPEQLEKENSDLSCEDSEKCSEKVLGEPDTSLNESTSNVSSNSSASSDVISGTPPTVSRRQSFITLEKFNTSENRPFSSSTFSNTSGASESTSALPKQGSAPITPDASSTGKPNGESKSTLKPKTEETHPRTKRSCLEIIDALETYVKFKKAKDGNKASSKSQSESTLGIKRSSLRQSNTDLSEDKTSKLMQSEQEKNVEVTPANHVEDNRDIPGETREAEHLLDTQTSTLQAAGNSVTENKQTSDSVSETKVVPNFDSKENTPPEVEMSGEVISNVSQTSPMSTNQKTLRRSLRRRPEATEGGADSQDKENSQQKKDGCREDEKVLSKKTTQGKEAASHKQKSLPEKAIDTQSVQGSNAPESVVAKECQAVRNNPEEAVVGSEKSEGSVASEPDDLQDSGPPPTGERPKGLPRYHTRRSSQGLLTSIENAESDNSETREEGVMRTRSGRWKNKNNAPGNQVKEELESQERHSQPAIELQISLAKNSPVIQSERPVDLALGLSNSEEGDQKVLPVRDSVGLKQDGEALLHRVSLGTESRPAKRKAAAEEPDEDRQGTSLLDTDSVLCSSASSLTDVSGEDDFLTAIASPSSEKSLEESECQHKRSKRARRSKGCDCCDEKSSLPLEKLPTDVRKMCTPEPKLKEHRKMPSRASMAVPSVLLAEELHSAEGLSQEPCATSTPLIKDFIITKESKEDMESEGQFPRGETLQDELQNPPCIRTGKDKPFEEILDRVDLEAAASEPSAPNSLGKASPALGMDSDPAGIQTSDTTPSGPSEEAEMDVIQAEDVEASEVTANVAQSAVEETTVPSATMEEELQENEMGQENAENDIAGIATDPQSSALAEKESNNSDSPLRSKDLDGSSLAKASESPNGMQARCMWSPSASPSTSILKRGLKRQPEEDSPSPANKSRRVSFANPIYQEELADDIDRRSPVVRTHSSNGSPSFRNSKPSPNAKAKPITTPVKGSLSSGSRSHRFKSSKKCLITEMVKEPLPAPTESIYPALVGCKAPVDTILPQITSNIWARGLGQLLRAKNIRTVGDLSSLSATEIKTLPVRSPKVSNVRRALKGCHEQQVKSRGSEESAGQDEAEKPVSDIDEKPLPANEDKDITDFCESAALSADEQSATDLWALINSLAAKMTSEELLNYSGNELFEMQEKLHNMTACIMKTLQTRWKSPPQESTV